MKILGQIVSIQPLALIVSLPNQLFAHVPITNVSSQLTTLLEDIEQEGENQTEEDDDEEQPRKSGIPTLFDIFKEGQYLRAVVSTVHAHGSADMSGVYKSRDEVVRASRRVELSLLPEKVNSGVEKSDLRADFASINSRQSV